MIGFRIGGGQGHIVVTVDSRYVNVLGEVGRLFGIAAVVLHRDIKDEERLAIHPRNIRNMVLLLYAVLSMLLLFPVYRAPVVPCRTAALCSRKHCSCSPHPQRSRPLAFCCDKYYGTLRSERNRCRCFCVYSTQHTDTDCCYTWNICTYNVTIQKEKNEKKTEELLISL